MKIKVLAILLLMSMLAAGGGIDSNAMWQFWLGTVVGFVAGGGMLIESYKEKNKHTVSHNNSYPCYLRK